MFQQRMRQWAVITFAAVGLAWAGASSASVIIVGTRVVYPADARDVNVRLNNNGELPAMVQAWLDTGVAEAAPETIDVPFRLTPSLFRIDPSKNQSLRLVYAPESAEKALPLNRESLFWLNVLEVPPRPATAKEQNYLQFAVRSRIKLFFRPKDLPGSAATAHESLKWQVKREGNVLRLTATNPTPFHVSFSEVQMVDGDREVGPSLPGMVAPGSSETFVFSNTNVTSMPSRVKYKSINDYGAQVDGETALLPAESK